MEVPGHPYGPIGPCGSAKWFIRLYGCCVGNDLKLGRIAGIPVGASWGLVFITAYLTWRLATQQLPYDAPNGTTWGYWSVALGGAILLMVSILVHEFGHAFAARREGIQVLGVSLWLLGGFAQLGSASKTGGSEMRIAVAGPLGSALCAAIFYGLDQVNDLFPNPDMAHSVFSWLAFLNVLLVIFNLLPGSPLDGGRILAGAIWSVTGNQLAGRKVAAYVGEGLGYALIAWGVYRLRNGDSSALLTAMVGWFISSSARTERQNLKRFQTQQANPSPQPPAPS